MHNKENYIYHIKFYNIGIRTYFYGNICHYSDKERETIEDKHFINNNFQKLSCIYIFIRSLK